MKRFLLTLELHAVPGCFALFRSAFCFSARSGAMLKRDARPPLEDAARITAASKQYNDHRRRRLEHGSTGSCYSSVSARRMVRQFIAIWSWGIRRLSARDPGCEGDNMTAEVWRCVQGSELATGSRTSFRCSDVIPTECTYIWPVLRNLLCASGSSLSHSSGTAGPASASITLLGQASNGHFVCASVHSFICQHLHPLRSTCTLPHAAHG